MKMLYMRLIDADEKKTRENDSLEKEESYECETDKKKFTTLLDELQGYKHIDLFG